MPYGYWEVVVPAHTENQILIPRDHFYFEERSVAEEFAAAVQNKIRNSVSVIWRRFYSQEV